MNCDGFYGHLYPKEKAGEVTLDLTGYNLSSLPDEIHGFRNLTSLILVGNQLTTLPREIGKLTKQTKLTKPTN